MGDIATQIRLLIVLDEYEVAQRAADISPIPGQIDKADRLYTELTSIAFACGFAPGRQDRNITVYEFAKHRAEVIRRVFPIHSQRTA